MSFRLRVALVAGILAFASGLAVLLLAWLTWQRAWEKNTEAQLRRVVRQMAVQIPQLLVLPPESRNQRVAQLGVLTGSRLTLIAADGTVLADSRIPFNHLALLENHSQRPEVLGALAKGEAWAHRRSATTGLLTRYLALRVDHDGQPLVVRVAQDQRPPEFPHRALLLLLLGGAAVGWAAQRLVAGWKRQVYQHLAPWCDLPADAETPAVAYEADRRFRRLREEAARELSACRQALACLTEGVVLLDRDQTVRFANPAAQTLLGKLAEGSPLWEYCTNPEVLALMDGGGEGSGSRHGEVTHNGRTLALTVVPLDHPVLAFALLVRDTSPQARFEAARRAFVADLAHELRTPVTVLGGILEELRERGNVPQLAEMLSRQVQRLSRFAADLEELVRIETGRLRLELAPVQLLELAREVAADFASQAEAQGVTVAVEGEPVTVVSDRMRLGQVLANLVDNAIRYNRPGGSVTVRVVGRGEGAELLVEDTGLGIPESEIPFVFQRLYRVRRGEGEASGSGLGLAIVKHLVARLGGTVQLASVLGQGTRVWIELPAAAPKNEEPAAP